MDTCFLGLQSFQKFRRRMIRWRASNFVTNATEQIGLLMALAVAAWPTHPPVVKLFDIYTMEAAISYYGMVGIKRGVSLYGS